MDNLFKLIRREIIFVKSTLKFQFFISLFFIFFFPFVSPSLAFMGIVIVPYFLLYGAMAYEEKSKSHLLLSTLPVSRTQICISKYVLGALYILLSVLASILFIYLGEVLLPASTLRTTILQNSVVIIPSLCAVGFIYIAIILPILFKLGTEKARFIMLLLYALVFAIMPLAEKALDLSATTALISKINPLILLFISLCIYLISMVVSTSISERKEY